MKKVFFMFAFAAMFFFIGCGSDDVKNVTEGLDSEEKGSDTEAADSESENQDGQADTGDTENNTGADTDDNNDTSADTGADTSADTDADTTADTGADTGDTGADTGDTGDINPDTGDTGDTGDINPDTGDTGETDPCEPNQCLNIEHSDGVCTPYPSEEEDFSCGCESNILGNYMWYDGKCRQVVTKHQCQLLAEFVQENFGIPDWVSDVVEFVCHCFTDQCVITWEP